MITVDEVPSKVEDRIGEGYTYGDYQFMTDETSPNFLRRGVFYFYKPRSKTVPDRLSQKKLSKENWIKLYDLAHTNKSKAFDLYSQFFYPPIIRPIGATPINSVPICKGTMG